MKAVVATEYCAPEQLTIADVPIPRPGPGQIQVRVAAASLNPADARLPRGDFREMVSIAFPHTPGNDFAGTVTGLGPGVQKFTVGDEVFGMALPRALRAMAGSRPSLSTGSLAEYLVCEADTPFIAHRPPAVTVEQAAALPTVGLTARAVMAEAAIQPGERVLVVGATGGVGTAVVALLAATKAHVIATATPADAAIVRGLGAADTIGYGEYPSDVDVAINAVLPSDDLEAVAASIRPGGRLLTVTYPVPTREWIGDRVSLRLVLDMDGVHGGMADVGELAAQGVLPATIGRSYPFADAVRACADFVNLHTTGKLVIKM